jgi:pimeloyl-ACP methyl ester carboxylesterase
MPHIDRDGVHLYYEVAALSARRRVITWDIRGHGRSDAPDDPALYSEALSVEDMAALLDNAEADEAIIGGLSLGGYLSLAFYLRYPERVAALVLCDTGPGYRRDAPRAEWNAMASRWADDFDRQGLGALTGSAEVRASHHRSPAGLALAARGILTQHDARVIESLPSIAVPALVLVGAEDKAFLAAADVMAAKIPRVTRVVLADAGHAANIDQPEAFDRAVIDFLDDL